MKIRTLLGAYALIAAGQALALPPTTTPDVELYIGGATAEQETLPALLLGSTSASAPYTGICKAGTVDIYFDNNGTKAGSQYRAYSCTLDSSNANVSGAGFSADTNVLIHYRLLSGSIIGAIDLARGIQVPRMVISSSNCTKSGSLGTPSTTSHTYTCNAATATAGSLVSKALDFGLSDVEPGLFVGANLPALSGTPTNTVWETLPLTPTELGNISSSTEHAVIMGIAANTALYNALQTAQGLNTADLTPGANQPTISSTALTSLLTANGGPLNSSWSGLGVASNAPVNICRRIPAVGTQMAANAFWGGYPCSSGGTLPATSANSGSSYKVVQNTLIGDVKTCLNTLPSGQFGIGLLFLDNIQTAGTDKWYFVKIDGVSPTLANVQSGAYPFYIEETSQYRTSAVSFPPAQSGQAAQYTSPVPTTGQGQLISLLQQSFGDPTLYPTNAQSAQGFLAIATGTAAAQTMNSTRNGNTCASPVFVTAP